MSEPSSLTSIAFNTGVISERARIIKLLENERFLGPTGLRESGTYMPIDEAIALIKGENK